MSMLAVLQSRIGALNSTEAKTATLTVEVACAALILASDLGGDKAAFKEADAKVAGVKSEATQKAISAWLSPKKGRPDAFSTYGAIVKGCADREATERLAILVAAVTSNGEKSWNDIRGQFRREREAKPAQAARTSDQQSVAEQSPPITSYEAIIATLPVLSEQQLNELAVHITNVLTARAKLPLAA